MLEYNGNMDNKKTNYPLIEERIEIDNIDSCKINTTIDNSEKINQEDDARLIFNRIFNCPHYYDNLSNLNHVEVKKQLEETLGKHFNDLPAMLQDGLVFLSFPGDNGRTITTKPDWFDMEKFSKGQAFARDNLSGLFIAQLYGLLCLICHEDGLKTLTMTKKSHTPYLAFSRYASTSERIRNWYTEDPWSEGTKANKDIHAVRRMHRAVRKKLCELDHDEIDAMGTIKNPYCPVFPVLQKDFRTSLRPDTIENFLYTQMSSFPDRPKSINQVEMSFTLFGFMGLVILFPHEFGIYPSSDEDLENFCHVWRSLGYLLGVEDDANFCRGPLEEVKQRGREYLDLLVKPAFRNISPQWEHMSRCIFEGFGYFFPLLNFEVTVLHLADLLDIEMPGLYASLTYWDWIGYKFGKGIIRWSLKFAIIRNLFNKMLNKILDRALNLNNTKRAKLVEKSKNSMLHVA